MQRETWRHFDFLLLGAVAVLTIFGIAMIRSAMAGNEVLLEIFPRQIYFALAGFTVVIIMTAIDYRLIRSLSRYLYVVVALLLAIITIAGEAQGGAVRWLNIGFLLIQPSELAKIAIILMLADFFASHENEMHDLKNVAISLAITLFLVIWIYLQPDLSTSITVLVIWFGMLWATGLKLKHLALFIVVGIVVAAIGFPLIEDYQQARIVNFLFPDPQARFGNDYNVNQALISIGSGGLTGQGYGQGNQVQLHFLKVRHTDFIFSALSEEFGLIGAVLVLVLLAFVIWRILRAARIARDTYGALICYGVAIFLFFHTIINVGMNMNLIPVTGLPLPFISYGGSSLLSNMLGIGLVESVVLRHKILEF